IDAPGVCATGLKCDRSRREKTFVPPDRRFEAALHPRKFRVLRIDQDIVFLACDDARNNQKQASLTPLPRITIRTAGGAALSMPIGEMRGVEDFVGDAARDGDLDEVLVGRHLAAAMYEFLQHRRGIVLARIEDGARRRIPSAGGKRRAGGVEDAILPVRVADPVGDEDAIETPCGHTAVPCSRRPSTSRTSCAPISLCSATSIGRLSSSNGCLRWRKLRAPSSDFQTRIASVQTSARRVTSSLCVLPRRRLTLARARVAFGTMR